MILITIDCLDPQDGDLQAYGRVVRGLENLQQSGYLVERFDFYCPDGKASQKKAILIQRTDHVDNSDYEAWLQQMRGKIVAEGSGSQ